jgi:chemotaxis protein histidine kinase CheA
VVSGYDALARILRGELAAVKAYEQNISALAIAAQFISGDGAGWVKIVSVILNIFAVMTAFFGVYLGFREATQGIVVILQSAGRRYALLVDQLIGQHQVVVKNLESNYRKVPGISAATILGDGSVALIVDVSALQSLNREKRVAGAAA